MTAPLPHRSPLRRLASSPSIWRIVSWRAWRLLLTFAFLSTFAHAENFLAAEPMSGRKIRIDGMLREWPGDFPRLSATLQGKSPGGKALVGYDETWIYLAANVGDRGIARTKGAGRYEDHLSLELFVPSRSGRGGTSHRIDVFPGLPGKLPALVKVDGKTIKSAQAVEAPHDQGLSLEARLPWKSIPAADAMRVGLQGRLVYYDASRPGKTSGIIATSSKTGSAMPPLTLEAETGLFQALIEPKGLNARPARHAFGDLTGKGGAEHVALYGHFLSIAGPGYKDGKQFYFSELDVGSADRIRRLELRDMSGDGRDEIILEKRIGPANAYREVLMVLSLNKDGIPVPALAVEIGMVTRDGSVRNDVTFKGTGKSAQLVVSHGKAKGLDPGTFREPTIGGGIISVLLPWESTKSRTYAWRDGKMAMIDESTDSSRAAAAGKTPTSSGVGNAPPPPRPPTAGEMLDRVYALYRKDRGVGKGKPRFDLVTDVVEDTQTERVLVHDRDLVVFGKGFKQGLSYTYLTIGVKESKDILSVATRDLVGDGKAEIIVHARLMAQASKQLGGDMVGRQALFIYKVIGDSLTRIFAAETARALEGRRVIGSLAFLPAERGVEIQLDRLRAIGFVEKDYPFPEDAHPAGGLEPLLLPWGTVPARRYRFDGNAYVQE